MLESEKDAPADSADAVMAPKSTPAEDTSRLLYAQPAWKKSLIMLAGVAVNFIFGWFFLALVLAIGAPQAVVITAVQPNSPAAQAGIMADDVVQGYTSMQDFINYVNAHRGTPIAVTVVRSDKTLSFNITPRVTTSPDEGALGVELEEAGQAREPVLNAVWDGLVNAGIVFVLTAQAFFQLFQQLFVHASLLPGVVGPVGIFGVAEETGKIGLVYLLQLIGIISINLTIVNLIPFPALDGGRFVMVIIEKIKGSAISFRTQAIVNGLGFAFLILLMVLLTIRDIRGLV